MLGILVNWDGVSSLAVAEAAKADFVRVEHLYTGVSIDSTGFMFGQCGEILSLKKRLGSKMPVLVDIQEVNANYLCPSPKPAAAENAVKKNFADGIFMSGSNTEESLEYIKAVSYTHLDVYKRQRLYRLYNLLITAVTIN